jgi:hypothetical protein
VGFFDAIYEGRVFYSALVFLGVEKGVVCYGVWSVGWGGLGENF